MAATHGTLDGPTVEEQVIAAEASSSVLQGDLKQMREDRREFIKVGFAALDATCVFNSTVHWGVA